ARPASRPLDLLARQLPPEDHRPRVHLSIFPKPAVPSLCFARYQKSFSCLTDGNQSDVVILRMRTGKVAHVLDDSFYNRRRSASRTGAHRLSHPVDAKFFAFAIERFRDALGMEDEAIVGLRGPGKLPGRC